MSISQGDNPDLVVSNRASAANAMGGYGVTDLVVFRQMHSTRVVTLTERPDRTVAIEADAMVTNRPDLLLGILTADCSPVLLADPEAGVIGAAHAGWKGAAGGIAPATVEAMVALGADPARIRAAIGPTISGANYEIGPDTARADRRPRQIRRRATSPSPPASPASISTSPASSPNSSSAPASASSATSASAPTPIPRSTSRTATPPTTAPTPAARSPS